MRVREPVGGRDWLLTDLWVLERRVTGNETRSVAMPWALVDGGPQRGHSLNHQYESQPMIEQSPQQRDEDGQLSEVS